MNDIPSLPDVFLIIGQCRKLMTIKGHHKDYIKKEKVEFSAFFQKQNENSKNWSQNFVNVQINLSNLPFLIPLPSLLKMFFNFKNNKFVKFKLIPVIKRPYQEALFQKRMVAGLITEVKKKFKSSNFPNYSFLQR